MSGSVFLGNYVFLANHVENNLRQGVDEVGRAASTNIANWLNARLDIVRAVAQAAAKAPDRESIRDIAVIGAKAGGFDVYVGTDDGTMTMHDPAQEAQLPQGYDPRKRPWYTLAKGLGGKGGFTEPYRDASSGDLIITAAAAFSGHQTGVAGGDLSLKMVSDIVNAVDFFGMGSAFLVSESGKILVHEDKSFADQPLSALFGKAALKLDGQLQDAEASGKSVLVSFLPIDGVPNIHWKIGIVIDRDKAYAQMAAFRNSAVLATVLGVVLVVGLMSLLLGRLMRPLVQLGNAMDDLSQGQGDLTRRLDVVSEDEIGRLAKGFNQFVEKIHLLVRDVVDSVVTLRGSVEEMSRIAQETSEQVDRQRHETDMVATAVNEMSAAAHEIAQNAQQAAEAAQHADEEGEQVKRIVDEAVASIEQLSRQIGDASDVINTLGSDVNSIVSVLSVIRGIAEQTNLLALNAAIEAARAGDAGRGFAVVADEVRALASKTQESTEEIQNTIERLQAASNRAVAVMGESRASGEHTVEKARSAGTSLDSIAEAIGTISSMNTQIAAASEEQTAVTEDISRSITTIADSADQTAAGTREAAETAQKLAELGNHLSELVAKFRV
ncbi:methyl-accepting chemotaxis protein [Hahella sp. SMD15-11]|uniref:Methyl-accepting chemotaxis protein n=1 Tax=Thermohahella caldifontis TaxID=3142973 RepID=A0AB39UXZ2_9GAMM